VNTRCWRRTKNICDVGTFDRMTDALHYHMYQMVVLANHAHFGGSNA